MSVTARAYCVIALFIVLVIPACSGSDPQSPANSTNTTATISGAVVYEHSGAPAAGVDVVLEKQTGSMMMGYHWDETAHMMTNSHGEFHFDYPYDGMHHYRAGVRNIDDWHMCDWDRPYDDRVVLIVPSQDP